MNSLCLCLFRICFSVLVSISLGRALSLGRVAYVCLVDGRCDLLAVGFES